MPVTGKTLRLLRKLAREVGEEVDDVTRTLTKRWVEKWDGLADRWHDAIADAVELAVQRGRWPTSWELARVERIARAATVSDLALQGLAAEASIGIVAAAGLIIVATTKAEPVIIASQLPAEAAADAAAVYAARILPTALDLIRARTREQITSLTRPLSAEATEAMNLALIRGVRLGSNPEAVARDMVARVGGAFNGGLTRALNIARTELLDAHRAASVYAHQANTDVLAGWRWLAELGPRCCPSCWAMHNTLHSVDTPGPWDHQSGRCVRCPVLRSWRELGFDQDEPADVFPDARAKWLALSVAEQDAAFGRRRAELVRSGAVDWADLPMLRRGTRWRDSYAPRPVRDLERIAERRRRAGGAL